MPAGEPLLVKPRHPGEVLDRAALIVRRTFRQSLRAVLIGYLPWAVLLHLPMVPGSQKFTQGLIPTERELWEHLAWICVWLIGDIMLLRQFARGWLFAIAGADMRGLTISQRQAAGLGIKRLPSAALATLLTFGPFGLVLLLFTALAGWQDELLMLVLIATPLLMLLGLPLASLGYLSVATAVLERRSPFAAMARSFRLAAAGLGTVVVIVVVLFLIRMFVGLLPSLMPNLWVQSILYSIAMSLLAIFDVAVEAVLHFTLRCQREDYDLELMAREVGLFAADELEAPQTQFGRLSFGDEPLGRLTK